MNYEEKCQLLLIGDSSVGKTSLIYNYTDHSNSNSLQMATVGIDYFTKDEIINNIKIRTKIWDTAGQERYKSFTQSFLRNAQGVMIVFDVSNRDTFDNLKYWISSLNSSLGNDNNVKIIIIGNKIDKIHREVSKEEAEIFTKNLKIHYLETSVRENINIKESFRYILNLIFDNDKKISTQEKVETFKIIKNSENNSIINKCEKCICSK